MQSESELDWMLEEAKKIGFKVRCDFDTRYRVWVNQILPGRHDEIVQGGGDIEYVVRMIALTLTDCERLVSRINKESNIVEGVYETHSPLVEDVYETTDRAIKAYIKEVKHHDNR